MEFIIVFLFYQTKTFFESRRCCFISDTIDICSFFHYGVILQLVRNNYIAFVNSDSNYS